MHADFIPMEDFVVLKISQVTHVLLLFKFIFILLQVLMCSNIIKALQNMPLPLYSV